jgi:myosin heavy subunit
VAGIQGICAGILWLGQVSFEQADGGGGKNNDDVGVATTFGGTSYVAYVRTEDKGFPANPASEALDKAAEYFGVSPAALEQGLVLREVSAGGRASVHRTPLECKPAEQARDTLAKHLYGRLFSHLIACSNEKSAVPETGREGNERGLTLGLLDIYGFEIFRNNSLEQLFINYVNEKLQQLFIDLVLKTQQEEYHAEGIDWVNVDFFDNSEVRRPCCRSAPRISLNPPTYP